MFSIVGGPFQFLSMCISFGILVSVHIVNLVGVSFEFLRTAQAPFMSTLLTTGRVVVDPVIIVLLMYSQCITILMIEKKTPFRRYIMILEKNCYF